MLSSRFSFLVVSKIAPSLAQLTLNKRLKKHITLMSSYLFQTVEKTREVDLQNASQSRKAVKNGPRHREIAPPRLNSRRNRVDPGMLCPAPFSSRLASRPLNRVSFSCAEKNFYFVISKSPMARRHGHPVCFTLCSAFAPLSERSGRRI